MEREERELFAKSVQGAVARGSGAALDAAIAELGWADALQADDRTAVSVLFEAQGRGAASSGALDLLVARELDGPGGPLVLPWGGTETPGVVVGGSVVVRGVARDVPGPLQVVAWSSGALVRLDADGLERRTIEGLDPSSGLVEVDGAAPVTDEGALDPTAWERAVAAGQRALAHELVGASAAMLDLAREHALDRVQFGVPIASFQAVRHKLADTYVAVESARAALDAAWDDRSRFNAAVAKAIAGRSARLAAKHCQQVLAGIGFTNEHALHRYVRRVRVLDGILGDARSLTRDIGGDLLGAGGLPPILPL